MELREFHCCHRCDSTHVQLSKSALVCLHVVKVCHMGVVTDGAFILTRNHIYFFNLHFSYSLLRISCTVFVLICTVVVLNCFVMCVCVGFVMCECLVCVYFESLRLP
jgi:hypothetical protein